MPRPFARPVVVSRKRKAPRSFDPFKKLVKVVFLTTSDCSQLIKGEFSVGHGLCVM